MTFAYLALHNEPVATVRAQRSSSCPVPAPLP
jgi:hypothetical protein